MSSFKKLATRTKKSFSGLHTRNGDQGLSSPMAVDNTTPMSPTSPHENDAADLEEFGAVGKDSPSSREGSPSKRHRLLGSLRNIGSMRNLRSGDVKVDDDTPHSSPTRVHLEVTPIKHERPSLALTLDKSSFHCFSGAEIEDIRDRAAAPPIAEPVQKFVIDSPDHSAFTVGSIVDQEHTDCTNNDDTTINKAITADHGSVFLKERTDVDDKYKNNHQAYVDQARDRHHGKVPMKPDLDFESGPKIFGAQEDEDSAYSDTLYQDATYPDHEAELKAWKAQEDQMRTWAGAALSKTRLRCEPHIPSENIFLYAPRILFQGFAEYKPKTKAEDPLLLGPDKKPWPKYTSNERKEMLDRPYRKYTDDEVKEILLRGDSVTPWPMAKSPEIDELVDAMSKQAYELDEKKSGLEDMTNKTHGDTNESRLNRFLARLSEEDIKACGEPTDETKFEVAEAFKQMNESLGG